LGCARLGCRRNDLTRWTRSHAELYPVNNLSRIAVPSYEKIAALEAWPTRRLIGGEGPNLALSKRLMQSPGHWLLGVKLTLPRQVQDLSS